MTKNKWAPQRGKKVMGIPERLGFAIVLVFVVAIAFFLLRGH